MPTEQITNKI